MAHMTFPRSLCLAGGILFLFLLLHGISPAKAVPMATPKHPKGGISWPLWNTYRTRFIQRDGRVIDWSNRQVTTSEGEAYALFFSLVDNDKRLFRQILSWTRSNLAQGDFKSHLPAWLWGKSPQGRWVTLDPNSASDADLWIAYALIEAGRIWQNPEYSREGTDLLSLIGKQEVTILPKEGAFLLPGSRGFITGKEILINPSYAPPFLLRALEVKTDDHTWIRIARNMVRAIGVSPVRLAPDWVGVSTERGFFIDQRKGPKGSYDAVRIYLWTALTSPEDPLRARLRKKLGGIFRLFAENSHLPEKVNILSGKGIGMPPPSLFFALEPFFQAFAPPPLRDSFLLHWPNTDFKSLAGWTYYDFNMALFSEGFREGRYRFGPRGNLLIRESGQ